MSILDQTRNPSRKQESVEEQDLRDSYLARNVNTRPESESFEEARERRGTGSEEIPIWQGMSILDQSQNPSRKQESEGARECRGTGSERFLSGKECQY